MMSTGKVPPSEIPTGEARPAIARAPFRDGDELAALAGDVVTAIRERAVRVHCITNSVAQAFTANVLLALGAVPSMTVSPDEIGAFVAGADGLLVNLGTLDAERRAAIGAALDVAAARKLAWVLDPVFVDRVPQRAAFARDLLARGPALLRLNSAELTALTPEGGDAFAQARRLAQASGAAIALSGARDLVVAGNAEVAIANGHPFMAQVTAMGCAASAIAAAACAVEPDPWRAGAAALAALGVAGEIAGERAAGPGSFAVGILDALHGLSVSDLRARVRMS